MGIFRTVVAVAIAAGMLIGWRMIGLDIRPSQPSSAPLTYYVSPGGNDRAAGTSPAHAWRTLARASAARLRPGNRLLLRGDHVYQGFLQIGKTDSGTNARRVMISSYGGHRATIASRSSGLLVLDAANVTISNLVIVGRDALRPGTAGINVYSNLLRRRLPHVVIEHVDVSGFGYGIAIGGSHDGAGFSDSWVKHSAVHGNLDAGLATYGPAFNPVAPRYANARIHIVRVRAYRNLGDPADVKSNSGSGIVLASVNRATITGSSAFRNGGLGGAPGEGPEGIWVYDATHVLMEHNMAYDNTTKSKQDGGGFGFDQGTTNSVMQYNLSYGNHGPGYLLYGSPKIPERGNVARFNISSGDGRGTYVLGGIAVGGLTINLSIYQNTVVMAKTGSQPTVKLYGTPRRVRLLNNIFVGSSGGPLVYAVFPLTTSDALLAGNDYVAPAGHLTLKWARIQYDSLGAWRAATREELVNEERTGLTAAPLFVQPATGKAGGAGFALKPASRLRGAGLDLLGLFRLHPGKVNYGGKPYLAHSPNIGAQ
ncbi:MAG TPA: right-handed parallel beta-helix repeat-containing protein [Streptosporangiaceae bacterium]|nr:right-handed parallel beta-helix repeat-containing protein [Streptosporangiaceae bacterium]